MRKSYMLFICLFSRLLLSGQTDKGRIERLDPALDAIIDANARVEIIADGFDWCEGPVWLEKEKMLIFSDVPQNVIYKWTAAKGSEVYLKPSGYTGTIPRGGELGSNGLALNKQGKLLICMDGDRRVAYLNAPLNHPSPSFTTVVADYRGKKFNSPNDMALDKQGNLYFTDPPYGLEKNMDDPLKEISFQGVYKVSPNGRLTLLLDSISRPNGIAITPDQKTMIIANSDSLKPYWYAFDLNGTGKLSNPRIWYNATAAAKEAPGMPDGLKIDSRGNVFATGPGGVWIFNSDGKPLGRIRFDGLTSNCALTADEKTLFITADMYLLRVQLRK